MDTFENATPPFAHKLFGECCESTGLRLIHDRIECQRSPI